MHDASSSAPSYSGNLQGTLSIRDLTVYPSYSSTFPLRFLLCFLRLEFTTAWKVTLVKKKKNMYVLSLCLSLASLAQLALGWVPPSALAHKRGGGRGSEQYEVKDKRGAVASESSVCSNIGIGLIKDGGNAADAVSLTILRI